MTLAFYFTSNNLGGPITNNLLNESLGSVFGNVGIDAATTGFTDYACVVICNRGAATIQKAGVCFKSKAANEKFYVALGLTGKNSATEQTIATPTTAPIGNFVFQSPSFTYAPLVIGTLAPGEFYHLWLKRVVSVYATGESLAYFMLTGTES